MPAFSPLLFLIVRPNLGREHDSVSTTIPGIYLFAVTSSKRKKQSTEGERLMVGADEDRKKSTKHHGRETCTACAFLRSLLVYE
jgi:hypothetical protein